MSRPSDAADASRIAQAAQFRGHLYRDLAMSSAEKDGMYDDIDDVDDIPISVLRRPRQPQPAMPPMPDLRFEHSYMKSIANADTWYKVLLITLRDQVLMPLTQGLVYNLILCGWQGWNRNARVHGNSVGARFRRWWYEVNNWKLPAQQ